MPSRLNPSSFSTVVHQLCGAPDLLVGLGFVLYGLGHFVPYVPVLALLWSLLVAPLLWSRFRLRLQQAGLGFQPLAGTRLALPLAGFSLLLAAMTAVFLWQFRGPVPEELRNHPAVTSAFGWVLGLTGLVAAFSLRWLRWAGYSLVLLAANAALFLGLPEGMPYLPAGLLMVACGLYSFRRYTRRHPDLLGVQPLRASR